jgi:hypothetical protein
MKQIRFSVTLFSSFVLAAALVSAQAAPPGGGQGRPGGGGPPGGGARGGGQPAAPLQNLKVFPKETTQAQILPAMRAFEGALQVECGYCHQWEGQGNPTNNFAADTKPQKDIARAMIKMVDTINANIQSGVSATGARTGDAIQKVTCATCHRGKAIPQVETYNPPAPAGGGGRPGGPPAGGGAPGAGRQ